MVIVISLKTLACTERCVYEKKKLKNMRKGVSTAGNGDRGGRDNLISVRVIRACLCACVICSMVLIRRASGARRSWEIEVRGRRKASKFLDFESRVSRREE